MSDLVAALQSALGTSHRVERELGGGAMSRMFLAEEVALGRRAVVYVGFCSRRSSKTRALRATESPDCSMHR